MNSQRFFNNLLLLSLISIFTIACGENKENGSSSSVSTMQKARGENGEIILVIAPNHWEGPVGKKVREIFNQSIKGVPQDEPKYNLKKAAPSKLNSVLKASKNLLFVATTDNNTSEGNYMKKYFTDNSIQQIENNPNLFSFNQKNVYASGQEVLYLFGRSEEELLNNLNQHEKQISEFFNAKEQERLLVDLKKSASTGIMKFLSDTIGLEMLVPYGYDIAKKQENFLWARLLDNQEEFNLWVAEMPYSSEEMFDPANMKKIRNTLGKRYITDIDNDSLYLTTQDELALAIDTVNLNGNYALEARGLWKYSDNSRGGAFISYLLANEETGRAYYIEGYLDNPGEDKREPLRILETVLGTADIPDTIND